MLIRQSFLFVIATLLMLNLAATGGLRVAQAQTEPSAAVPSVALARMPKGAVSLRFETRQIGADTVGLHLFALPKGRNPNAANLPTAAQKQPPITRAEILTGGDVLNPSPYFADIFTRDGSTWTLRHRAEFSDTGNPGLLSVKYLRPVRREGPIFFLDGGYSHWKRWVLIVLPGGIRSGKAFVQAIPWGGEGEYSYSVPRFDTTDAHGFMTINEVNRTDEKTPEVKRTYRWNGERFVDRSARYFLIADVSKNRAEAEAACKKLGIDSAEVVRTSGYSKLKPGLYAVVLSRLRTSAEANQRRQEQTKAGIPCYVKRAF